MIPPTLYEITAELHSTLSEQDSFAEVKKTPGSHTNKINIFGEFQDGRNGYQSLACDKNGNFHFSQVDTANGGKHEQYDVRSGTVDSETAEIITKSLFATAYLELISN